MPPRPALRRTSAKSSPKPSNRPESTKAESVATAKEPVPDAALEELPPKINQKDPYVMGMEEGDTSEEEAPEEEMEDPEEESFEEEAEEVEELSEKVEEVEEEVEEEEEVEVVGEEALEEVEEEEEVDEEELEEVEEEEEEKALEEVEEEEEEEEEGGVEYGGEKIMEQLDDPEEEVVKEVPEPIKQKRKQKEFEVFVGGLPRDATEGDLQEALKKAGEVIEVRLAKIHHTSKNKGFGFVRFATIDQARKAANELKRIQIKGKSCGVRKSDDNETLHLANICTTWTKVKLVEKLRTFKLENLEEVHLIEDPHNEGKNRGYAFLDFSTHLDAVAACIKFHKRNVYFGTDVRAEVSFSKTIEPDDQVMAQVKSIFVDGLPASWDETRVRQQFKKFGEIESVQLARNMLTAKRKDFGFVSFTTRQAALDCMEKVNKDGIGEGDQKVLVKVTLKKPLLGRRPPTLGVRRGPIFKRFGRDLHSHGSGHSLPGRPAKSHDRYSFRGLGGSRLGDRSRGLDSYSSRGVGVKGQLSPPTGKYRPRYRKKIARDVSAVSSRISRDLYSGSSSSGRYALASYQDVQTDYSQSRGPDAEANVHDCRFECRETYECRAVSGYKRSYSELDRYLLASSSLTSWGRSRSALTAGAYSHQGGSAYDEYSRFLPDEQLRYDRKEYSSREYGNRYFSGTGAYRSYY
ncbi:putative nucleolin [Cocos nucifera]|uniref:Putative nucleolin n=1 Tax=Cocos nucifera TaxID=13894 RepID=A0A8K0N4B0_COCNU|nr:putative nucleolin [Cocos nucifera]